jgi:hypothetical protein
MVVIGKGMRPFMAEKLAERAVLSKTKFGEDSGSCCGRDVDVAGGTVVLPAKAVRGKRSEPYLHLGQGVTPQTQLPELT